jgi:cytochrome c
MACPTLGLREDDVTEIFTLLFVSLLLAVSPAKAQDPMPAGDPAAGALVFKKCLACHQVGPDAKNGIAPVLNGVVGREAGQYPGYNYSPANKKSGLTWDESTLARYLRAPGKVVPGTKMIFAGLTKDREISDVIAYLKQFAPDGKQISP